MYESRSDFNLNRQSKTTALSLTCPQPVMSLDGSREQHADGLGIDWRIALPFCILLLACPIFGSLCIVQHLRQGQNSRPSSPQAFSPPLYVHRHRRPDSAAAAAGDGSGTVVVSLPPLAYIRAAHEEPRYVAADILHGNKHRGHQGLIDPFRRARPHVHQDGRGSVDDLPR
jgi:hypothetical protein